MLKRTNEQKYYGEIMTYENFVYWLRGFLEVANPDQITKEQIQIINRHLNLCLNNITTYNSNNYDKLKLKEVLSPQFPKYETINPSCVVLNGGSC